MSSFGAGLGGVFGFCAPCLGLRRFCFGYAILYSIFNTMILKTKVNLAWYLHYCRQASVYYQ